MNARNLTLVLMALMLVGCTVAEAAQAPANTPAEVVEEFYAGYLAYIGMDRETGDLRNPLAERAYRDMQGLAPAYVERVDAMLEEGLHADPFLCAQDIPTFVEVVAVEQEGGLAVVTLRDSFVDHVLEVELSSSSGEWLITRVSCAR